MLMIPCVHAVHPHEGHVPAEGMELAHSHACCNELCSKPTELVPHDMFSSMEIPVRRIQIVTILTTDCSAPQNDPRPPGGHMFLQSVQLLI